MSVLDRIAGSTPIARRGRSRVPSPVSAGAAAQPSSAPPGETNPRPGRSTSGKWGNPAGSGAAAQHRAGQPGRLGHGRVAGRRRPPRRSASGPAPGTAACRPATCCPRPACSPVYTSNRRTSSSSEPSPAAATPMASARLDVRGRHRLGHDQRDVLGRDRVAGHHRGLDRAARRRRPSRSPTGRAPTAQVRGGSPKACDHPRVQLARVPGASQLPSRPARPVLAGTAPRTGPGATARAARARTSNGTRLTREHLPGRLDRVLEHGRRGPRPTSRTARGRRPAPPRGAAAGRAGPPPAWPPPRASARGPRAGSAPGPWPSGPVQEHQAGLEQGDVGEAAADVAAEHPQQPGQQRGAHQRLLVPDRVDQPDRGAARVVGGSAAAGRRPRPS